MPSETVEIKTLLVLYVPLSKVRDVTLKFPEHPGDRLQNSVPQKTCRVMVYYIDNWTYYEDQVRFLMGENITFIPIPINGPRPAVELYRLYALSDQEAS